MISHGNRFIFIHIPKCAGTSIESAFGYFNEYSGRGRQDHRSILDIERTTQVDRLTSTLEILPSAPFQTQKVENPRNRDVVSSAQYDAYFKFTLVRNPWARAFSWYGNVLKDARHRERFNLPDSISLKDFLTKLCGVEELREQLFWITDSNGHIPMDYVGRFENIQYDFEHICKMLSMPKTILPHILKGGGGDYRDYYDSASADIVRKFYAKEIDLFEYLY